MSMLRSQSLAGVSASIIGATFAILTLRADGAQPAGTWDARGALTEVRVGASATPMGDGRVLVVGGANHDVFLSSAEVLDATGHTTIVAALHLPRAWHTATRLEDGRVLVAGGTTIGGIAAGTAEIFDPQTDQWAEVPMHLARTGHTATLVDGTGRVIITGGLVDGEPSRSVEEFDARTATFAAWTTPLRTPRASHAAVALRDGRVLALGGFDGVATSATAELIDPSTRSIATGPAMLTARQDFTATALVNGDVLVVGGNDGTLDLASAERWNAVTRAFVPAGRLAAARSHHAATRLPGNNGVLVVGGSHASQDVLDTEIFLPQSGLFKRAGATIAGHAAGAFASPSDAGVLIAGGGQAAPTTEEYRFATIRTNRDTYAPGERVTITGSGWTPGETVGLVFRLAAGAAPGASHPLVAAVADEFGNIVSTEFVPDAREGGLRLSVTAYGTASEAQHLFTHGRPLDAARSHATR